MRGISPVIATVIIIAVAITIAVAVALWITGLTGTFTRYERLEIVYAYAEWNKPNWTITLTVKNTGPSDATIDEIFINGRPLSTYNNVSLVTPSLPYSLASGTRVSIEIRLGNQEFMHGATVEIKIHSAAGNEYPKQVTLP